MSARRRATLIVEVDLAESGELSTINHWRMLLQRQLDDFAGAFRPLVRGATGVPQKPPLGGRQTAEQTSA